MSELRFDNRVAVITGAGRGLGREYALLLASKGAKVVVNDPGSSIEGAELNAAPAQEVVREIIDAGGEAIANMDSVATEKGGQSIIDAAIKTYGRIDILIHNAGNVRKVPLSEISWEDFSSVMDVHLNGGFYVVRAAFPYMCKANYGRIILTGSINGLYGNAKVVNYSVAKAGLMGLSNVAALEGAEHNVKSNIILPGAVTRMADGLDVSQYPPMGPGMVAPMVGWLAHDCCSVSGEMYISMAGRMARAYVSETRGMYQSEWTTEDIEKNIDKIRNTENSVHFPPAPSGHVDHLKYCFSMVEK